MLTRIATACRDHLKLRLNYRDRAGNATARTVEPLRLAHTGHLSYLVAWDVQRADWRTFRMDRIQRLVSTGPHFAPREFPGDVAQFVARSMTRVPYRYRMRLTRGIRGRARQKHSELVRSVGSAGRGELRSEHRRRLHQVLAAQVVLIGTDFEILDSRELAPRTCENCRPTIPGNACVICIGALEDPAHLD